MSLTRDQKASLTAGRDMWSTPAIPSEAIPSMRMADGPMGIASGRVDERDISVLTPSGVAIGASWDIDLARRVGALVGVEAKRLGVDMMLAPNLNLPRSPLAGRAFELYAEDPLLTGLIGAAWIAGLQSRHVGSVAKHLVCNDSETARDRYNAVVDERTLREVYLLPFELAAEAGCAAFLMAYNKVNGHYCAEQRHLITDIVKAEWGFAGFTVSDWFGTHDTLGSTEGGLDLEMPGPARVYGARFLEAVERGEADEARLDDAASRVARAAQRWAGANDGPEPEDRQALLVEAAAAGFTLLRNDGDLLPLQFKGLKRLAVIGPNAAEPCFQGGTFAKISISPDTPTPVEAIRARFGQDCEVLFEPGVDPQPRLPSMEATPGRDIGDGCLRGMTVDYFDSQDFAAAPVGSETRDTNSLTWFAGLPGPMVMDRPAGVRACGWYTAERDGVHRFHVGGTATQRLLVDGLMVLEQARAVPASDIMGVLKAGDSDSAEVELTAGQLVRIEVEFRYAPARAHGLWYGVRAPDDAAEMMDRAVRLAETADAVVLVVGETADAGVESKDRTTTALADEQLELIARVCTANPRTAVVVNVGHAFDASCADAAPALMAVWYAGEAFAAALAQVLAGDREPAGRLPVSLAANEADYPAYDLAPQADGDLPYAEGTRVGYRGLADRGAVPAYSFGGGLGYGRFDYETLEVVRAGQAPILAVTVSNSGARASSEVVQVYGLEPLVLLGFAKAMIGAGERRRIEIALSPKLLRRWDETGWAPLSGPLKLGVGRSAGDVRLQTELTLD